MSSLLQVSSAALAVHLILNRSHLILNPTALIFIKSSKLRSPILLEPESWYQSHNLQEYSISDEDSDSNEVRKLRNLRMARITSIFLTLK
jgi:hypothetical protein